MKKHFLILMLMALLPLAGWAQTDLSEGWEIAFDPSSPVHYDATNQKPAVKLKKGTDYLTTGFNVSWDNDQVINPGSYTVTVTADNVNTYDELAEPQKKFWVLKAVTEVTNTPAVIDDGTDGLPYDADGYDLLQTAPTVNYGTVKYLVTTTATVPAANAEEWSTEVPHAVKPGTYYVYIKVDEDANWAALAPQKIAAENSVKIKGTALEEGEGKDYIAPTALGEALTYDGEDHALITAGTALQNCKMKYKLDDGEWKENIVPQAKNAKDHYTVYWKAEGDEGFIDATGSIDVTIAKGTPVLIAPTGKTGLKYNKTEQALLATNGSVTLGATLQYKVNGGEAVDAEAVKGLAAGNYSIVPTVAATDNTIAKDFTAVLVTIAPKDVYVSVQDKTKVYDGAEFNLATAVIDINGLEAGDVLTGVSAKYVTAPANAKNVGEYKVTTTGGANANYTINRLETGKFTIKVRPITLTAKDKSIIYGKPAPAFAVTTDYIDIEAAGTDRGLVAGESAIVLNAIESVGLKEAKTDIGTYTGNIVITKKETAATDAPNYEISVVAGTYEITAAGGYTLIAQNKNVTYGEAYTLTYLAPNGDVKAGKTVTYDVYKGEVKLDANPTDAGTYTIKIQPNTYAPDNFGGEEAEINYVDGLLVIAPKALKIIPQEQTLRVGKKATDLVATKVTFDDVVPGDEGKIDYTLAFNTGDADGLIAAANIDESGALLAAGVYAKGIKAVLSAPAATNRNANYTLDAASVGKLTVVNAATLVLGANPATDAADIAVNDGAEVTVKIDFSARNDRPATWQADTWATMTLPFDISVGDLSKALGYAVVNVIDPKRTVLSGTGSKFYGKLVMKGGNGYIEGTDETTKDTKLAANKPFMVKTAEAVTGTVNFGTQKIVAPGTDLSVDADEDGKVKFTGTYTKKTVLPADNQAFWFMTGSHSQWGYIGNNGSWDILPFEGFIDMSDADPAAARSMTFYFEEIDGSTTAIKGISTDDLNNKNAEGWYNLNGMKMDGASLQKGIYIKNGKKVVIK